MQQNGLALKYVPNEYLTKELILEAVQQNELAWQYVDEELCLKYGISLEEIPPNRRTINLCLIAVKEDVLALKYVPDEHKKYVIDMLSFEKILTHNYLALNYFPEDIKQDHDFKKRLNDFLSNMEYIVVNNSYHDHELKDIQLTYASTKKRLGKTICIYNKKYIQIDQNLQVGLQDRLFDQLYQIAQQQQNQQPPAQQRDEQRPEQPTQQQPEQPTQQQLDQQQLNENLQQLLLSLSEISNSKSIHLVLIGHSNPAATELSGFNAEDIAAVCKRNPQIKNIHLLGCFVAQAKILEQEEMIEAIKEKADKASKMRYGFITSTFDPVSETSLIKCMDVCKKFKLDGIYILNKIDDNFQLYTIKVNDEYTKIIKNKNVSVSHDRITDAKILKKSLPFPNNKNELLSIRDNKPLSPTELNSLRALRYEQERFDPSHQKYQQDKKKYPFLTKIEAKKTDLKNSLLEKITNAIINDKDITWEIHIQGPTKSLHVDTEERRFKISRTHPYTTKYDSEKKSYFFSRQPNIKNDKIIKERNEQITKMEKMDLNDKEEETMAKQIIIKIKK